MTVRNSAIMVTVSWVLALLLAVFPYFVPDAVTADNKAVSHNYRYIDVSTQVGDTYWVLYLSFPCKGPGGQGVIRGRFLLYHFLTEEKWKILYEFFLE